MANEHLKQVIARMKYIKSSDERKYRRYALDNAITDPSVTDIDDLKDTMKNTFHYILNTEDSDGNQLKEWTISSEDNDVTPTKLHELSSRYIYNNDNVKKAIAQSSLDPIPLRNPVSNAVKRQRLIRRINNLKKRLAKIPKDDSDSDSDAE